MHNLIEMQDAGVLMSVYHATSWVDNFVIVEKSIKKEIIW